MKNSISIAKEKRHDEKRVVLLPQDLNVFFESGFEVFVEENAGLGVGASNEDYRNVGARIVTKREIWQNSTFIAKLLCPTEEEVSLLSAGTHVSAFFYPGEHYKIIKRLNSKNTTAYSYEYFEDETGHFPMMAVDGWLSGRLALQNAAFYLQLHHGGAGLVLGGPERAKGGQVLVIGSGNVGCAAIDTALSLGANVTVAGRAEESLDRCAQNRPEIRCVLTTEPAFATAVSEADIIIGAILISTYDTPPLIDETMVRTMRPGSIIVDVTCGYGVGYLPTADKITMPGTGPYVRHGLLHYKNPRLPAMTPLSAAKNASRLYAPYLLELGSSIAAKSSERSTPANGCIIRNGKVVHHHVQADFEMIESEAYQNYELADHILPMSNA